MISYLGPAVLVVTLALSSVKPVIGCVLVYNAVCMTLNVDTDMEIVKKVRQTPSNLIRLFLTKGTKTLHFNLVGL